MKSYSTFLILFFSLLMTAAEAANFTVTNSNNSGAGSLRQAALDANALAGADTITFDTAGHFSVARTITVNSTISFTDEVTVTAPSAVGQQVSVSGGDAVRVFSGQVNLPGGTIRLRFLRIVDGRAVSQSLGDSDGGGIWVTGDFTTLRLEDCVFVGNFCGGASGRGGAVCVMDGTAFVERGNFTSNEGSSGGGLAVSRGATATVTDCTFFANQSDARGGGLLLEEGTLTMSGTLFTTNTAGSDGGGVYIGESGDSPVAHIEDCTFTNNSANYGGGLKMGYNGDLVVTDCTFSNNDADFGGGASLDMELGDTSWLGCTFSSNDASFDGGGCWVGGAFSDHTITNCTFSGNAALREGGGCFGDDGAILELLNCTMTLNSAPNGQALATTPWSNCTAGNCIFAGNTGGESDIDGIVSSMGNNFIGDGWDAAEQRVSGGMNDGVNGDRVGTNAAPLDPMLGPLAGNGGPTSTHRLEVGSPCLEAGKNNLVTDPPFPGPNFKDQRGEPRIAGRKVDIGAYEFPSLEVTNTNNNGAGSLRDVLATAMTAGGGVITFRESVFAGTRQTITLANPLNITDDVSIIAPEVGVRLDGNNVTRIFTITAGVVELQRLEMDNGSSGGAGGALSAQGPGVDLTLKECVLRDSTASSNGGGLYAIDAAVLANKCLFYNNTAGAGGGIYIHTNASLILTNSTVSSNDVTGSGGGILFNSALTSTAINSTITLNNCDTDTNNTGDGGGCFQSAGTPRFGNCIIADNSDAAAGTSHHDLSGTFTSLGNNLVGTGFGATGFTHNVNGDKVGTNVSRINPLLGPLGAGVAHIPASTSPVIDMGSNALLSHAVWLGYPSYDQRGQVRIFDGTVDAGSVEYPNGMVVEMSVPDIEGTENSGNTAKFRFQRTMDLSLATITVTIHNSSTVAPGDYTISGASYVSTGPSTFQITFPGQEDTINLTVTPVDDTAVEGTETLTLQLTGSGHTLDPGGANLQTVSIRDSDWQVTNNADSGAGSLRDALSQANANNGGTIKFNTNVVEIFLTTGPLVIDSDTDISGDTILNAQSMSRVMEIRSTGLGCVLLRGLTLTGGNVPTGIGGAGLLVREGCVEVRECSITSNSCGEGGGGFYTDGGTTLFYSSSIDSNTADSGGGIGAVAGSFVFLTNCTVARNLASGYGGGAYVHSSELSLTNVTMTDNVADNNNDGTGDGGGIFADYSATRVIMKNSAITGNQDTPSNAGLGSIHPNIGALVLTSLETQGNNFVGRNTGVSSVFPSGTPNGNGDYAGTAGSPISAQLTPVVIAGPMHYVFPSTSYLHNAGNNAGVVEPNDQRLRTRIRGAAVDIGAVELNPLVVTNANNAGGGSLRAIIGNANSQGGGDITFDPAFFNVARTINMSVGGTYLLSEGVTIEGPASASAALTISGGSSVRIFDATTSAWTHLKNLTLANGRALSDFGGAFYARYAAVENCIIQDCAAGFGGGVHCNRRLHLFDSTIKLCSSQDDGGAVRLFDGGGKFVRCSFVGNVAGDCGGALAIENSGGLMENCTISGNEADAGSGILLANSYMQTSYCTLTRNVASSSGGGLRSTGVQGSLLLDQCIIAGNVAPVAPDASFGMPVTADHTLIGIGSGGVTHGTNGNIVGTAGSPIDPKIGPLANNGGSMQTHALLCGSPAINAGLAPTAGDVDQRGQVRDNGNADMGAYELKPETYEYWSAHTFPDGAANTGATQDYDGDGVGNGIEFATGSVATNITSRPVLTASVVGTNLLVDVPASPTLPLNYAVMKTSGNLQTWTVVPALSFSEIGCTPEGNRILRATIPKLGRTRLFARLELVP